MLPCGEVWKIELVLEKFFDFRRYNGGMKEAAESSSKNDPECVLMNELEVD